MNAPNLKPRDSAFFDKKSFFDVDHNIYEEYEVPGTGRKVLVRGLSTYAWSIIEQQIQKAQKLENDPGLEAKRTAEAINRNIRLQMLLDGVVDPDTKKPLFSDQDMGALNKIPAIITLQITRKIEDLTGISKRSKSSVVENLGPALSDAK